MSQKHFILDITDLPSEGKTLDGRFHAVWLNSQQHYIGAGSIKVEGDRVQLWVTLDDGKEMDTLTPLSIVHDKDMMIGVICR